MNPYVSLHQNAREKTRVKTGVKAREKMLKKKVLGRSRGVSTQGNI